MLREASSEDLPKVLNFLEKRSETSMFLRSNLLAHGLEPSSHPHSTKLLLWENASHLKGVFGLNNQGNLVSQLPEATAAVWKAVADWLNGKKVVSLVGEPDQVLSAIEAFGWNDDVMAMNHTEPLYSLAIKDVRITGVQIRKPTKADLKLLKAWFKSYMRDTGAVETPDQAETNAIRRSKRALETGTVRLMIVAGAAVCMVGTNARAANMVQIGGVYTPPQLRGRGYAGQALAAYLLELGCEGVTDCILFAASKDAARAYEKIGFQHIGHYHVTMLKEPIVQVRT